MRSYAREVAVSEVYRYLFTGETDNDLSPFDADKLDEKDAAFIESLVDATVKNKSFADAEIERLSVGFRFDRIFKMDLAILETAICEMKYIGTPGPVVINEAVSVAKKYSSEKSVSFVNGILAAYYRGQQ